MFEQKKFTGDRIERAGVVWVVALPKRIRKIIMVLSVLAKLVANGGFGRYGRCIGGTFREAIEGASIDANKGAYSSAWMIVFPRNRSDNGIGRYLSYKGTAFYRFPPTAKKTTSEVGQGGC